MDKIIFSKFTKLMQELQVSSNNKDDIIAKIVLFLRNYLEVFSIGIRIKDGEDFPYYTTLGFSEKFLKAENFLCCKNKDGSIARDGCGNASLECMCGSIINKIENPKKNLKCFTERGSFWTNSTKCLIEETKGDIGVKTRGTCVEAGYKSIAIIPIPYKDKNIGLIQLNDFEENKFTLEIIEAIEEMAVMIGCLLGHMDLQNKIQEEKKNIIKNNIKSIAQTLRSMSENILKNTNDFSTTT